MRASGTIALQLRESTENFVIPAAQGMIVPEQPQCKDASIICQLLPGGCRQVPLYPFSFLLLFFRGEDCCWWQYLSHWLNSLDHYSGAPAHGMIGAVSLSVPQHLMWKTQDTHCLANGEAIEEQKVVVQSIQSHFLLSMGKKLSLVSSPINSSLSWGFWTLGGFMQLVLTVWFIRNFPSIVHNIYVCVYNYRINLWGAFNFLYLATWQVYG